MKKYFKVSTTFTSKPMGSKEPYRAYHEETSNFQTEEEVKKYLSDTYGNCKRAKIFQDPDAQHVGYIYCFIDYEWHGAKEVKFFRNDWVAVTEVTEKITLIK